MALVHERPADSLRREVGLITTPGTRYYQAWYRDPAGFCTVEQFNLTNGIAIEWQL